MISRRFFLSAAAAAGVSACTAPEEVTRMAPPPEPPPPPLPAFYGAITDEPYPVPAIPVGVVDPKLWRQEVANPFPNEPVGTVIVDPDSANLHLVESADTALRYGVSVGAAGYGWNGIAVMHWKQKWPRWKAPDEMIERQPQFAPYSVAKGGMAPGPGNPLGARALYLFQNGEDTLYRIHGACEPQYLGKAVSSGCIRMLDQDVIDLYDRVRPKAKVVVLKSMKAPVLAGVY